MGTNTRYPFSDLTSEQIQALVRAARHEQSQAIRNFFARLLPRQRTTQAWPAKHEPALSLRTYC